MNDGNCGYNEHNNGIHVPETGAGNFGGGEASPEDRLSRPRPFPRHRAQPAPIQNTMDSSFYKRPPFGAPANIVHPMQQGNTRLPYARPEYYTVNQPMQNGIAKGASAEPIRRNRAREHAERQTSTKLFHTQNMEQNFDPRLSQVYANRPRQYNGVNGKPPALGKRPRPKAKGSHKWRLAAIISAVLLVVGAFAAGVLLFDLGGIGSMLGVSSTFRIGEIIYTDSKIEALLPTERWDCINSEMPATYAEFSSDHRGKLVVLDDISAGFTWEVKNKVITLTSDEDDDESRQLLFKNSDDGIRLEIQEQGIYFKRKSDRKTN